MPDASPSSPGGASAWRRMRRGRRGEAGERLFRVRRTRGATFFTSRQQHQDLTVVLKRFPSAPAVEDAEAPVFVLVHGLGVSSRYFQPLAAELARTGRVFVVDLPGYGAAPDPRREVSIQDHAAVLHGVLLTLAERWPLPGPPILVGHSMGSQVVAELALRHPELAPRIVLMAPAMPPHLRAYLPATLGLVRDALREPPPVWGVIGVDFLVRSGLPYMARQAPHMFAYALEEHLPAMDGELLVVCGDRDPLVPAWYGRCLAGLVPQAEYAEVAGPHVVMHSAPGRVAAIILNFVRAAPASD